MTKHTRRLTYILWLLIVMILLVMARSLVHTNGQALDNHAVPKQQSVALGLSEQISVRAAGRGNPYANLRDGHNLLTTYVGESSPAQILQPGQAHPASLASADFDEDGVPDLVSGYSSSRGGLLTLYRGNVDSIYPNAPEAKQHKAVGAFVDSPFFPSAKVFEGPEAADFLEAGDFDGDGHWDVVTAARGSALLHLFSGNGRGDLKVTKSIQLPGAVTTLVAGEVNRRDGLIDLAVGISGLKGPQVLVFESPLGALLGEPEVFSVSAEVTAMAMGQLDNEYSMDLAVATGSELLVFHGRDRKLSLDETECKKVPPALISKHPFELPITSIAVGNFTDERQTEIAVLLNNGKVQLVGESSGKGRRETKSIGSLPDDWSNASRLVRAKVSSLPHDDLVLVGQANHKLYILGGEKEKESSKRVATSVDLEDEPVAVLPMRLNEDTLSDLVILQRGRNDPTIAMTAPLSTFVVNSAGDGQDCSPNDGICATGTINAQTGQCVLTNECTLRAAIQQTNASAGIDAISFSIGSGTQTITPLSGLPLITSPVIIDGTTQPGFSGSPIIELNGASAGASVRGLTIAAGSSTVKGIVINRFGGPGILIFSNGGNTIQRNFIGTDVNGTTALGNYHGVEIDGVSNNVIGGTAAGEFNVISGNKFEGVFILFSGATDNLVQGNYIGTDVNGTADLGNNVDGVGISGVSNNTAANNTIGGTAAGARNIMSGNDRHGIDIGLAAANLIQGNYIGTDVTATMALGNTLHGVNIDASNNTVGGSTAASRNIISGNAQVGVGIVSGSNNTVQGNYIGTDLTGTLDLGNGIDGVRLTDASNNNIGGTSAGARNIISGNNGNGVIINVPVSGFTATGNIVQGNYIGTDLSGTLDLGNSLDGVSISVTPSVTVSIASNNKIGGTSAGARNVISGNNQHGVDIAGSSAGNTVQGNYIGTDVSGAAILGNTLDGVNISGGASTNSIGGATTSERNLISGNNGNGVQINGSTSTGNQVLGNFIGTQANGASGLPNTGHGVFVTNLASNNTIGGTATNAGNKIQNNGGDGVFVASGTGNSIRGNSIFGNAGLGIDLGSNGVTPNDSGDVDSGANNLQNFPELTTANLNSKPNAVFIIDFYSNTLCDASGFGEGQIFIGSVTVTTNSAGNANFSIPLPGGLDISQMVTATATDASNNTSEFSPCAGVFVGAGDIEFEMIRFHQVVVNYSPTLSWHLVTKTKPLPSTSFGRALPANQARALSRFPLATVANVKIELSRNGGVTFETLFASTPNDGSECWLVTGPTTTQALIRISSTDNPSITGTSKQPFEIISSVGVGVLTPVDVGLGYCVDLSPGDGRSPIRGSSFFADRYSFPGSVGQQVAITLTSPTLDTYLYLVGPDGSVIAQDNNGGGGTDSRIPATNGFFTLPTSGNYVIEATSFVANALGGYQLRLDTGPLVLTAANMERSIALDSVTMIRDPFPIVSTLNFSSDHRTRVSLFAANLELLPGEDISVVTAQAEDSQHRVYPLTVEYVGNVPNFGWLTQVNVRLPDQLANAGDVFVSINLRGVVGNRALINIR